MRKQNRELFLILGVALLSPSAASAATSATASQTITVHVAPAASISLASANVNFAGVDPASSASVDADEPVTVTAKSRTGSLGSVLLTVVADGDLASGPNHIGIDQLTWAANGDGFIAGTMSKSSPQTVAMWTGSGIRTGSVRYRLTNGYGAAAGTYTTRLVYTLLAP